MVNDILIIVLVLGLVLFISTLVVGLSYFANFQESNFKKQASYECGFQPFEDARQFFNIEFFLVGILFVIFDLEIVFLFPLCLCLQSLSLVGALTAVSFFMILTLGFIYEWLKGSLNW